MNTEEIFKMLQSMHRWLGNFRLEMAGGEPTLRKDLIPILEFAHNLGITISFTSNGIYCPDDLAKVLTQTCECVSFSLLSTNNKTHDCIRGVKGSCEKTKASLLKVIDYKNKTSSNVYVKALTIFMFTNHNDILNILKWADDNDISQVLLQAISFNFFARDFDPNWKVDSEFWPKTYIEKKEMIQTIEQLITSKKNNHNYCWKLDNSIHHLTAMKQYFMDDKNES